MPGLVKKILGVIFLVSSVNSLKFISMKNQEFKVRQVIVNNEYMLFLDSIKTK